MKVAVIISQLIGFTEMEVSDLVNEKVGYFC
jgi:hypothetical protein